ncbi:MAG: hypothetical protein ACE5GM_00755 [bacterium]
MKTITAILSVCILLIIPGRGAACVGRKVYLGYGERMDQEIISQVVATFISERTGSAVVLREFSSYPEMMEALYRGEISLAVGYLSYQRNGFSPSLKPDRLSVFRDLKQRFMSDSQVVLLPSLGDRLPTDNRLLARTDIPVLLLRKKTAIRFPVLPRLLKKLSYRFDHTSLRRLKELAGQTSLTRMAWEYLNREELI